MRSINKMVLKLLDISCTNSNLLESGANFRQVHSVLAGEMPESK
jgi:hypothetical protein